MEVYSIIKPSGKRVPVILSVPHSGTGIPESLKDEFNPDYLPPDDTDWFVDDLYSFAGEMGITMIKANLSRWVIDLNRDPESQPLYTDGRIITGLCPVTDFNGNTIYHNKRDKIGKEEMGQRKKLYFYPYHQKIQELTVILFVVMCREYKKWHFRI